MSFETLAWKDGAVVLLDQRRLPAEEIYLTLRTPREVADAIRAMAVRGAPAIGVTAAMGLALGAAGLAGRSRQEFRQGFEDLCEMFAATRPTAVNLFLAIQRMRRLAEDKQDRGPGEIASCLKDEALKMKAEDLRACRELGRLGAALLEPGSRVLTHCNAGALATSGFGTALGVIRAASRERKIAMVYADETRPFLQGARLTAWELMQDQIPVTLIADSMAGHLMSLGKVNAVIVGADRIAANGDTANKIGTYQVAVLAREHELPFYVAAPTTTIDPAASTGHAIPIEERDPKEITTLAGKSIAPDGVKAANYAFDVTPARLVTAIITEAGIARPPYRDSLAALLAP
ncbi:MAG: S-methyl-5-thioribose-1-phosphate isomerase [Acidobacteriota bacterium]